MDLILTEAVIMIAARLCLTWTVRPGFLTVPMH